MLEVIKCSRTHVNSLKIDFAYLQKNIKKEGRSPLITMKKTCDYGVSNAAFAVEKVP